MRAGNHTPRRPDGIERAADVMGDRWRILVMREAFYGVRRYGEMVRNLGIARNVLTARLKRLTDEGLLERRRYQERPERFEYRLTQKGIDLWPVLFTLMRFGDKHVVEGMPPTSVEHKPCGTPIDDHMCCPKCGVQVGPHDVIAKRGEDAVQRAA